MEKKVRAGMFFDGYHVFDRMLELKKDVEHINYNHLIEAIKSFLTERLDIHCDIMFKGWYQGMNKSFVDITKLKSLTNSKELQSIILKYYNSHMNHYRLLEAGVETTYLTKKKGSNKEKGVDVAFTIAAGNRVQTLGLDTVILLTNDSDFAPLIHNLKKKGVVVITLNFDKIIHPAVLLKNTASHSISYNDILSPKKKKTAE